MQEITKLLNETCAEMGVEIPTEEEIKKIVEFYDQDNNAQFDFDEVYDMVAPFIEDQFE